MSIDNTRSYGNVPIVQTHETINEGTTFFHTRFWMSSYLVPSALTAVVFPIYPHDKETLSMISHRIKPRRLGPHTHQGPHQTGFSRSVKMDFDMEWFGAMYSIDSSVMLTPSADFIRGQHMSLLGSGLNMTITQKIMEAILSKPDIYELYRKMLTTGVQQRYTPETIDTLVMDLRERVPGFIGGQGCSSIALDRNADMYRNIAPSISAFLMTADEILHTMKVSDDFTPNFFIMGSSTARSINVTITAERQPSQSSSRAIAVYLNKMNTTEDISLAAMRTVTLGQITTGVSLIPIDPIREDTGVTNLLSKVTTVGLMYPVRIPYDSYLPEKQFNKYAGSFRPSITVSIPNFERRQNETFRFEHPLTIKIDEFGGYDQEATDNKLNLSLNGTDRKVDAVQRAAASYYIGTRVHKYASDTRWNTPDRFPLEFLMVAARNRLLYNPDATLDDAGNMPEILSKYDSISIELLSHKRMFYHTLDVYNGAIEDFTPTGNMTQVFKRVTNVDDFKKRHATVLSNDLGPNVTDVNDVLAGSKLLFDDVVNNAYLFDTMDRCSTDKYRVLGDDSRESGFHRRKRAVGGGFVALDAFGANALETQRLANFGSFPDEILYAFKGVIFESCYHAVQFILDMLFIIDDVDSQFAFPPSVNIKIETSELSVPARPNYDIIDIVQPKIMVNMEAIVYGIGGEDTGVVALGQQSIKRFTVDNEQHEEVHITARMLVAIKEPDHLVIVPDAAYRGYIGGGSAQMYGPKFFEKDHSTTFAERASTGLRRKPAKFDTDMVAVVAPEFVSSETTCVMKFADLEQSASGKKHAKFINTTASDIHHCRYFLDINSPITKPDAKLYMPYIHIFYNPSGGSILFGNAITRQRSIVELTNISLTLTPINVSTKQSPCLIWRHMPNKIAADTSLLNQYMFSDDAKSIETRQSDTVNDMVSRGPLRYITAETGMDTFCGRPVMNPVRPN